MNTKQAITACAFIHKEGKLLIAKRADTKSFLPGKYELLGGHVEFGETMEESLVRELNEELHIDIKVGIPFYAFTYLSDNHTVHNVEVDYFAELVNPQQTIRLNPEDHSDCKWITADEVDRYFDENDAEKHAVKRGFAIVNTV